MKKWNTPAVAELDIEATANGFFDIGWETPFDIIGNDKKEQKPSTTPSGEEGSENKVS